MTKNPSAWRCVALLLTAVLATGTTGCKSAGGSKWAWNPWSKPKLDPATALASSSPKLPSDGATPLIETSDDTKPAATAVATVKTQTPPAIGGMAPALDAVAKSFPTIDKPAPEPNWKPYPTGQAAATPAVPAKTAVASGGPYDPNGYKPKAPATTAPAAGRYGGGDRYASAPTPDFDPSAFADLPPAKAAAETAGRYGDRYASAQQSAATTADRYANAAAGMTEQAQTTADRYAAAPAAMAAQASETVDRYATAATQAMDSAKADTVAAATTAIEKPMAAVAQATSLPAPPAYPTTPPSTTQPSYPIATATVGVPASAPSQSPDAESPTVGTLPPETSVYASRQPITPIEPASASTSAGDQGSVVRLTTLPGEYRPGGTSTYPSTSTSGEVKRY